VLLLDEVVPRLSNSRTGINNNDLTVLAPYLKTHGITAALFVMLPGNRYSSSGSIAPNNHLLAFILHQEKGTGSQRILWRTTTLI
jgi:hypothetical protein